jgi:adenylate kinase family enzyme
MHRVLVIGSGGAGKSTLAARLARRSGLPLIHLDACYWRPGWVEPPQDEWAQTVAQLIADEQWIMDGNYGGTLEQRLAAADTVVFLDLPRLLCLRRRIRYHGRPRPDMPPGCPEQLSWQFLRWIWSYTSTRRPGILRRLSDLKPGQRTVILRSAGAVERFLQSIPAAPANSEAGLANDAPH